MFVEVYGVKLKNHNQDAGVAKVPENRRLIELTGARLRPYQNQNDKCEIKQKSGVSIICAGTYDEIVQRVVDAQLSGIITRVTPNN
jgi:hypothetical protein